MTHKREMLRATFPTLCCVIVCVIWPIRQSEAQGWTFGADVTAETSFDDNPLLRRNNAEAVFGGSIAPSFTLKRTFRNSSFEFGGGLNAETASGDGAKGSASSDLDRIDYDARARFATSGQSTKLGIGVDYANQSARTSELTDTGNLDVEARRSSVAVDADIGYTLTQRNFVDLSAGASDVTFDSGQFSDFRSYDSSLAYRYSVTSVNDIGVSFRFSRFDPESSATRPRSASNTYTASFTWTHKPSADFSLDGSIGADFFKSDNTTGSTNNDVDIGLTWTLDLSWNPSQRDALSIGASNSVEPSASGFADEKWTVSMNYAREITDDVKFSLPVSFQFQEQRQDSQAGERKYFSVEPEVSWGFLPGWRVATSYRFRGQDSDTAGGGFAYSNAAFIRLKYNYLSN